MGLWQGLGGEFESELNRSQVLRLTLAIEQARVKNRIKSTLSIKGNLFIKVPRPSSAAGKGSWWTLSQEAQDLWKAGKTASVVKTQGSHATNHSRSHSGASSHAAATGGASKDHSGASASHNHAHGAGGHSVGSQSAGPSSRHGSPVIGRRSISGLSPSLSMTNLRNAIYASGIGQAPQPMTTLHPNQPAMSNVAMSHPMGMANYHAEGFSSPFAANGAMTPTAGFLLESMSMSSLDGGMGFQGASPEAAFAAGPNTDSALAARRMRMMENRYAWNELPETWPQPSDPPVFLPAI